MKRELKSQLFSIVVVLSFACGGHNSGQHLEDGGTRVIADSVSAVPAIAVYSVLVEATLLAVDSEGRCTVGIDRLRASGAGAPVVAAGDSVQVAVDPGVNLSRAELSRLVASQEPVVVTLKYIRARRLGQRDAGNWTLVSLQRGNP